LLAVLKANNPDKFRARVEQVNTQDLDIDKLALRYSINWQVIGLRRRRKEVRAVMSWR
jgi:hypothetical protein